MSDRDDGARKAAQELGLLPEDAPRDDGDALANLERLERKVRERELAEARKAAWLDGARAGLEAAARYAADVAACDSYLEEAAELVDAVADRIRAIDPEAIAKEADNGK